MSSDRRPATYLSGRNSFCVHMLFSSHLTANKLVVFAVIIRGITTFSIRPSFNIQFTFYILQNTMPNINVGEIGQTISITVRHNGAFIWKFSCHFTEISPCSR